jgi:predicted GIY-YIG superfamily endonuclease
MFIIKLISARQVVDKGVTMAKDSQLWERAYTVYKASNKTHKTYENKTKAYIPNDEPTKIMHQITDITKEIRVLINRKKLLRNQLSKMGNYKIPRSEFFDKTISLYILMLEDNCWYIGQSRGIEKRFRRHLNGKGAIWTKTHTPLEIVYRQDTNLTDEAEAALLEDELTIEYARRYGVDYVRGGGYCQAKPHWPGIAYEPEPFV